MVSTSRLRQVERQWRRVVFDRVIRPLSVVGLAAFAGVALVSLIPALAQASRPVMDYVLPFWFAACVWLVASSYLLTAALCFAQRDKLTGAWMSAWVVLLTWLGLVAFRHILRS